jgi:hypothetical protein
VPEDLLSPAVAVWLRPLILMVPLFFAGLCFSTEIKDQQSMAPILASNLFGALVGGALEYNAMYFGFKALYLLIFALYAAAWFFGRKRVSSPAV